MRCDIEERASQGLSCSRCTKLRLSCLVDHVNSPRVHNERSELQVQIERMQDIVGKVATDEGTDDFDASELDLVGVRSLGGPILCAEIGNRPSQNSVSRRKVIRAG